MAEKYYDDAQKERISKLVDTIANPLLDQAGRNQAQDELTEAMRPAISKLVDEVAAHQDTKDAMDFVCADIAGKPEISLSWDYERDELVCEIIIQRSDALLDKCVLETIPASDIH